MQVLDIDNPFKDAKIYYKSVTDSTMDDARTLITDNPETGTVISAGEQLSGRGRVQGRKWLGGKDLSLMFTLFIKEDDISFYKTLFPLYAGFCVMSCLEKYYNIESCVKWPNDVLVRGEKISGILCENTDSYLLCGCGINLNQEYFPEFKSTDKDLSESRNDTVKKKPVSLYQLTGEKILLPDFLIKLLNIIKEGLGSDEWKNILEKRLYLFGENAVISEGIPGKSERIEGVIDGLGEYGQLMLKDKTGSKIREVYSGEIF